MVEKDVFEYLKYEQMTSSTHEFTEIKSYWIMPHFLREKEVKLLDIVKCLECNKTLYIVSLEPLYWEREDWFCYNKDLY